MFYFGGCGGGGEVSVTVLFYYFINALFPGRGQLIYVDFLSFNPFTP